MAWAESPNTISYHPNISSEIILTPRTPTGWDSPNAHQESFVAGEVIEAVLHLETKAEEGLSIRRIEVECLAREDARTTKDALGRIFWSFKVPFQGTGMPPSNAVYPEDSPGLPNGYHPARKGNTSFRVRIPLPTTLPGSLKSSIASISYTLHANIELAQGADRHILHRARPVQVIPSGVYIDRTLLGYQKSHGDIKIPPNEGGGMVRVDVRSGGLGGWAVEGERAMVDIGVINSSPLEFRMLVLRLIKTTHIHFRPDKEAKSVVSVEVDKVIEKREVAGHSERSCVVALDLPDGHRSSLQRSGPSAIVVSYSLQLSVVQDTNPTRKIEVSIPIHIFNLASLPSDLWLEHETFLSETRHKASQRRYYGEKAQRRWSTPVELLSGFVSKHRPLPTPTPVIPGLPRRLSSAQLASPPRMSLPPSPLNNSQPEWIIHRLPAVVEETETKAVRTSRHLRETSGNRGRSVSPPPAPLPVSPPRLRRPPSVVGPRPAPPRSTSYPLPVEPVDSSPQSPTRLSTPPLLSPVPLNMEPNSYFDQQVHSLSPETPLDLGKLSPGTVMSLESLAEQLELNTPGMDKSLPLSPDESRSRAMNVPLSSSPLRERPSIFSVFSDASRPEATRRESSERRVAVETRHLREASHAAEVFEESPELQVESQDTSQAAPLVPKSTGSSSVLLNAPQTKSPTGSARGGRGGKVAAVKDIFTAIERQPPMSPPVVDKRIRRKSVPHIATFPSVQNVPAQNKRHSVALVSSASASIIPPIATTRPVLPRNETVPTPLAVKQFSAPPPVDWKGDRAAKKAFENVDIKEEQIVRKRGTAGKLKALIDRFEKW